jgi:antitoxin component of RelBE/YafQ-DinJ toxin-antitoxin module
MAKLTLSVDDQVISRAKQFAQQEGISVSEMVETYLSAVSAPARADSGNMPILRSLRGVLKKADVADYRKHLDAKYR